MQLITTYRCEVSGGVVRYYGRVEMDDGLRVELGSERELTEPEWLALAAPLNEPTPGIEIEIEIETAEAAVVVAKTITVEAEDGTVC